MRAEVISAERIEPRLAGEGPSVFTFFNVIARGLGDGGGGGQEGGRLTLLS